MRTAFIICAALLAACGDGGGDAAAPEVDDRPAVEKVTDLGPVTATVRVRPEAPALTEDITLELEVEAEPGIAIELPAFGEALGRFQIVDFAPRQERTAGGGTRATQTYRLQAPMSGKQRVPPLRVEYLDERPGQDGAVKELLTEEIPLEVASTLPEELAAQSLRPARGRLEPPKPKSWLQRFWFVPVGLLVLGFGIYFVRASRRRARTRARASAFATALHRLAALEARGFPVGDEVDAWYVELSGIVRRYIEGRYGLRAPELTTEEFLQEAGRLPELGAERRALLESFLEGCDRVKFAGYRPDEAESLEAIAAARRFLLETRPAAEEEAA